ncbi:MAG: PAS domain-containing protein [Alphaproteobacteria bacterium]|nr:PAS domain-containing protein [Alphaproteobacteria bacterium]MDE2112430.1 PAS domain-containing protein [Alphaproteobacteria bacterium]MDE2494067.1 PAS domain-containing protein [Alphaproteobacteria bacterium]
MPNPTTVEPHEGSDATFFEPVTIDELESQVVKLAANYWNTLRGSRRYPARQDLRPRDIAPILRNMVLAKVIDGGADFEFRIAGDAQVQAYGVPFQGKRLSEVGPQNNAFSASVRGIYRHVVESAAPIAVRGRMGAGFPNVKFAYCESLFLPLGPSDDVVDHILVFSTYVERTFTENKKK